MRLCSFRVPLPTKGKPRNSRDKYEVTSDKPDREMARSGLRERRPRRRTVIVFVGISGDLMSENFRPVADLLGHRRARVDLSLSRVSKHVT